MLNIYFCTILPLCNEDVVIEEAVTKNNRRSLMFLCKGILCFFKEFDFLVIFPIFWNLFALKSYVVVVLLVVSRFFHLNLPVQPEGHSHVKSPSPSRHIPPLRQGFGEHSLRSAGKEKNASKINLRLSFWRGFFFLD